MNDLWYKNSISYAIALRSFQDSNGDGIGDLRGATSRLPYLADLGITCVWLLPHYPTPDLDHGYDVTDYYSVDPRVGTLNDFSEFVRRAGELGIRVLIDLVVNHTSDQHPWYQAARRSRDSRFRDYYVWSKAPGPKWPDVPVAFPGSNRRPWPEVHVAFPESEKSLWAYDEVAGEYYFHLFYRHQPDLNTANPEVVQEILRIADFWMSFGIAGFRIDAVGGMVDKRLAHLESEEEAYDILAQIRQVINRHQPDGVLLGEADLEAGDLWRCFGNNDRANLLLNFVLSQYLFLALAQEKAAPVKRAWEMIGSAPEKAQWTNFLRNLDELNLSKIPEGERELVYRKFGPDSNMRLYHRGIRRRVAPMLTGDRKKMELAYSLLFSLPGSPLIVYGDEIGMGEDLSLVERHSVRTPMQWSARPNAGFSDAPANELIRPVLSGGPFGFETLNAEAQDKDPKSFLNWMRKLILIRRSSPEIGGLGYEHIDSGNAGIHVHRSQWEGQELWTVHNLSGQAAQTVLSVGEQHGRRMVTLLGGAKENWIASDRCRVSLEPYGYVWYRLEASTLEAPLLVHKHAEASGNGMSAHPAEVKIPQHERE